MNINANSRLEASDQPEASREERDTPQEVAQTTDEDRLEALKSFEPSGDFESDVKAFLEATGRDHYLNAIQSGKIDPKTLLLDLRSFQKESLNPDSDLYHELGDDDPEKRIAYRDIPGQEVETIGGILESANLETDATREEVEGNEGAARLRNKCKERIDRAKSHLIFIEAKHDRIMGDFIDRVGELSTYFPGEAANKMLDRFIALDKKQKDKIVNSISVTATSEAEILDNIDKLESMTLSEDSWQGLETGLEEKFDLMDEAGTRMDSSYIKLDDTLQRFLSRTDDLLIDAKRKTIVH